MGNIVVYILITATASALSFCFGVLCADRVKNLISRLKSSKIIQDVGRSALVTQIAPYAGRCAKSLQTAWIYLLSKTRDVYVLLGTYKTRSNKPKHTCDVNLQSSQQSSAPNINGFNCRVEIVKDNDGNSNVFSVDICGLIDFHDQCGNVTLTISIADITEWEEQDHPIYARTEEHHIDRLTPFCYSTGLGQLPTGRTTLSNWTVVAKLRCDRLWLPRKGNRLLQFTCIVTAAKDGHELTRAEHICEYENQDVGYLDFEQNCERATNLGVGLAFAVSASDSKLFNCEIELIKDWARSHVRLADQSEKTQRELEKQLDKTVAFFRKGNRISIEGVCKEIVTIAPVAERYDILDLCLRVAQAKGMAAPEELAILKDIALWLQVDSDKFRSMMEKILPVGIHEIEDSDTILGIHDKMSEAQIRQHLTREYGKWNSRVTNPDPQVRQQADQMLKLIAEARERYATQVVHA